MSTRNRRCLWILAAAQFVAWWAVAGLFAFGALPPASDPAATYMVFSAVFGIGGAIAAATFPGYPS